MNLEILAPCRCGFHVLALLLQCQRRLSLGILAAVGMDLRGRGPAAAASARISRNLLYPPHTRPLAPPLDFCNRGSGLVDALIFALHSCGVQTVARRKQLPPKPQCTKKGAAGIDPPRPV